MTKITYSAYVAKENSFGWLIREKLENLLEKITIPPLQRKFLPSRKGMRRNVLNVWRGEEACEYKCVQGPSSYIRGVTVRCLYRVRIMLQK